MSQSRPLPLHMPNAARAMRPRVAIHSARPAADQRNRCLALLPRLVDDRSQQRRRLDPHSDLMIDLSLTGDVHGHSRRSRKLGVVRIAAKS